MVKVFNIFNNWWWGGFGLFPIFHQSKQKAAVLWKHYCLNKGDWGINIWSLGLLLTGIKTLAKMGRPSGCAGRISSQSCPVRMGMLNLMPRVKRVPRSLHFKNPCNNSVEGFIGGLLQGKISVPIQYTLIFQWQSKFCQPSFPMASIMTIPTYCIYC